MELKDENISAIYVHDEGFYNNLSDLKSKTGPCAFTVIYKSGKRDYFSLENLISIGVVEARPLSKEQLNTEMNKYKEFLKSLSYSNDSAVTGVYFTLPTENTYIKYLLGRKNYYWL